MAENNQKWWAKALMISGVVALVCLLLGPVGTKVGIWSFQGGFILLAMSMVLAVIALIGGLIALIVTFRKQLLDERASVAVGMVIGAVIVGVLGSQVMKATSVPPIHNITTNPDDPPAFAAVVPLRGEGSNPHAYDADKLANTQREAYPWLAPLESDVAAGEMFNRAVAAVEALGFELVNADAENGIVEATDETFWFGFKDDVVLRVRESGAGSVVDVRSVSRVGESDLGANAARIREILAQLSG